MPLARGFALKGTATSDGDDVTSNLRKMVCAAVLHSMLCTLEINTGRLIILIAPRRPSSLSPGGGGVPKRSLASACAKTQRSGLGGGASSSKLKANDTLGALGVPLLRLAAL